MKGRRSGEAIAAQHRNAGPMKDRRAPRGGQRNEQADLLDEHGQCSCGSPGSYHDSHHEFCCGGSTCCPYAEE